MSRLSYKDFSFNRALSIVIATAALLASCTGDDGSVDLFEGLPPEMTMILTLNDSHSLRLYGQEKGLESLVDTKRHFEALIQEMPRQEYLRYADSLYTLQRQLCVVLADEYDYDFFLNDLEFLESFSPAERQDVMIARADIWMTVNNGNLPMEAKVDSIAGYYDMMMGNDDAYGTSLAKIALFHVYDAAGEKDQAKQYLIDAADDFSRLGFHRLTCQSLGILGVIYEREGKVDSMEICFQRARDLAIRHRLSNQISRISYFFARRYARMGRLALANDMFNEAIELCREYRGGYIEIRYIYHAMEFYSEYSCWDTVARLLSRAKVLASVYDDMRYSKYFDIGNKFIEAQWLMARGNITEANTLYREIDRTSIDTQSLVNHYNHLYYWARGLLENGLVFDAVRSVDRGLCRRYRKPLPLEEGKFLALKARVEFER